MAKKPAPPPPKAPKRAEHGVMCSCIACRAARGGQK